MEQKQQHENRLMKMRKVPMRSARRGLSLFNKIQLFISDQDARKS